MIRDQDIRTVEPFCLMDQHVTTIIVQIVGYYETLCKMKDSRHLLKFLNLFQARFPRKIHG